MSGLERMWRRMIGFAMGTVSAEMWLRAAADEPPVFGEPRQCGRCPCRLGGEWHAGATAAVAAMDPAQRRTMARWGCHAEDRPCRGMRDILAKADAPAAE